MRKFVFTLLILLSAINIYGQNDNTYVINWPDNYLPSKSRFFVHNEIEISAPPEVVWKYLVEAENWESWYKGARNVSLINTGEQRLNANSIFRWETMGLKFESKIMQFEENRLLAWESRKRSIQGYHAWLIIPTANGCKVVTDESQNGWLTFFEKLFQGKKLKKLHDIWLIGLKQKAEGAK